MGAPGEHYVLELAGLFRQSRVELGMCVAVNVDPPRGGAIEDLATIIRVEVDALRPNDGEGRRLILASGYRDATAARGLAPRDLSSMLLQPFPQFRVRIQLSFHPRGKRTW